MKKAIQTYKWLNQLPESILKELDYNEFYLDHSNLDFSISELENEYDANIMIYKADKFNNHNPNKKQLCQSLKLKPVPQSVMEKIKKLETESSVLISIVLYENPVGFKI